MYDLVQNKIAFNNLLPYVIIFFFPWFIIASCIGQNMGINTNSPGASPDASAALDLTSSTKGLLIPRLTDAQRNAILSPANGLLIYNTTTKGFNFFNNTNWVELTRVPIGTANVSANTTIGMSIGWPKENSAVLTLSSVNHNAGLLIPRMSAPVPSPAQGLLIYNTANFQPEYYNATQWKPLCGTTITGITILSGSNDPGENASINSNGNAPDPSSVLDISSTNKGLLIPRIGSPTTDILSPANGLVVYNTSTNKFNYYDGTNWLAIDNSAPAAPTAGFHTRFPTQIIWKWNTGQSTGLKYKYNTADNYGTATDNGTSTSYTQNGLTCGGGSYTIYVWAYSDCGNSSSTMLTQTTSSCGIPYCGTQVWQAANLNVGTLIAGVPAGQNMTSPGGNQKYCYNDLESNCTSFGGLYEWGEAMDYNTSVNCDPCGPTTGNGGVQGICPAGFHIPSDLEWSRYEYCLENTIVPTGSTSLETFQTGTSYRGENSAGVGPGDKLRVADFNMKFMSGCRKSDGTFTGGLPLSPSGFIWSGTEYDLSNAWYRQICGSPGCPVMPQSERNSQVKYYGYSVRCLQD